MQAAKCVWIDGAIVPWEKATVHVMSHALHYGSSVFEGIRVYETQRGSAFFRLSDHVRRLFDSCRIHRLPVGFTPAEIERACRDVVLENGLPSAYVRPLVFRGYGTLGLDPGGSPPSVLIAAVTWGAYLGEESRAKGIDVCVSSWQRVAPNTLPPGAKAGGNYVGGSLITMEAHRLGFDEGIALGVDGTVAEGAGENIFVVREGTITTPIGAGSILAGLTRDTALVLARKLGYEVRESPLPREALYTADEIFLTGTAAEIAPVRSVDGLPVGTGERGAVTRSIQEAFFGLFDGSTQDAWGWLQPVEEHRHATANAAR